MTEAEWEQCLSRRLLLQFIEDQASERKLRLWAIACCRQRWDLFSDKSHRKLIEAAEQYADGTGTSDDLKRLVRPFEYSWTKNWPSKEGVYVASAVVPLACSDAFTSVKALTVAESISNAVSVQMGDYITEFSESEREVFPQITAIHDIVGNPFYPEAVEQGWLTDTVVQLARVMYESRDFSAMPILADALQDAGCDNHIILNHCQGRWPHVRGCWVVDLILGKE